MKAALVVVVVFNILDDVFYGIECKKRGPLYNYWPGSGFYEWIKGNL